MKEIVYKEYAIRRCLRVNTNNCQGKGWYIQTYEQNRQPRAEEHCPHFLTLKQARAFIDELRFAQFLEVYHYDHMAQD
ncbi:MAG: hypothetical protein HY664_00655 [Chloroflexi bacterium]|nr:hypothetical protein [Chloroflexota bacterium]